jgi:hypothetical protein
LLPLASLTTSQMRRIPVIPRQRSATRTVPLQH